MSLAVSEEYLSSLLELTCNNRPQICMLTMLADDYYQHAASIAYTIETHLASLKGDRLPVLYLVDSIVKNVGKDYIELFSRNLPSLFAKVFAEADNNRRCSLYKLRVTWDGLFPKERLNNLDTLVKNLDPGWPVVVRPSNIHVNPDFIKGGSDRCAVVTEDMREKILKERKELLELKKKRVELELLQTREVLEKEQKKLESFTTTIKVENKPPNVLPDSSSLNLVERLQSSSSLRDIESENSKKLLEVSIRDPRRKVRQTQDVAAAGSPLSGGTSSPVPGSILSESGSPYNSEDSRDRPPRKKHKPKEKKRHKDRDKDVHREHSKKPYKPKMPEGVSGKKKDNTPSYKPSNDVCLDYGDMEGVSVDSIQDNDDTLSSVLTGENEQSSREALSFSETLKSKTEKPVLEIDKDITMKSVLPVDANSGTAVRASTSRSGDPRLSSDSSVITKSSVNIEKPKLGSSNLLPEEEQLEKMLGPALINSGLTELSVNPGEENNSFPVDNDLISRGNNLEFDTGKRDIEFLDSSSRDTIRSEGLSIKSSEGLPTVEEMLSVSEENSIPDISSKMTSSKRKFDLEEDNEKHKRRLILELQESGSGSPASSCSMEATSNEEQQVPTESSPVSSGLVAPPAPIIPPLVDTCGLNELNSSVRAETESVKPSSPSSLVSSEQTGKDVDLRLLLPGPVERIKEDVIIEKSELDTITLFGGEDVDYRQKPPSLQTDFNLPSPPPPPVIGNLQEATAKNSWAQIKDRKSEERSPRVRPDRIKRPSISQARPSPSRKETSRQDSEDHCKQLIKDAEEQLQNGNISFVQYNKMLQEVVSINEERILKEAKARFSSIPSSMQEDSRPSSPICEVDNSFKLDQPEELIASNNLRETNRTTEPTGIISNRVDPPHEPCSLARQYQLPEEPFRRERPGRERFDYIERRVTETVRDRQPPNMVDNFSRQRPPMQQCITPAGPMPFPMEFRPRMPNSIPPTFIPPVNIELLMEAERERMDSTVIGGQLRQVRFYGTTPIVLMSWDDPREARFPVQQRSLIVDQRHEFGLRFGDPPTEMIIDGMSSFVQLGAPTRELYIDNKYFSLQFGGRSIEVLMCGRVRAICLGGPPPIVSFSPIKRTDLVAGSVTLYVNAKANFQFFLDAKPQKFHIEGEPCVLQFADSLQTVLINGKPVPLEFGGLPVPVMLGRIIHFLRLTLLPYGIIPGQISIMNMENFAHPPAPMMAPPMPPPSIVEPTPPQVFLPQPIPSVPLASSIPQQPSIDLLASVMNPPVIPSTSNTDNSYSVEPLVLSSEEPQQPESLTQSPVFNINSLFQKLIQTGILHSTTPAPAPEPPEVKTVPEIEADFCKPETLKLARPGLVSKLYSGIQCSSCGIRFPPEGTKMYSRHLDWHFRQNKREKHSTKKPQCRGWYYDFSNWMQYQELDDPDDNDPEHLMEDKEEEVEEDMPSVAVGHRKDVECRVCREKFEEFFDHETEEWHARNALLVEDSFYHPLCYEEFKNRKEPEPIEQTMDEEEEGPPLEDPSIEVIDLDDTEVPSPVPSPEEESLPLLGPEKDESPEIIALDDVSDDKSEIIKTKEEVEEESEDDDILDIIPIERKIESVELLDDDDDEKAPVPEETNNQPKTDEEDFDFTKVTVKQEKDRVLANDNVDSSQPTYTATIDGNIVHDSAPTLVQPTRIKINIHRSATTRHADSDVEHCGDSNDDAVASNQPPPPGEETIEPPPPSLKPRLVGVELSSQPPVDQGMELSGLCSIM